MEEAIVNKVADSGIITLNMEQFLPLPETIMVFDIKPYLFKEMILREKDFRQSLTEIDWTKYKDKHVSITCSADAIIPMWAYMLIAAALQPYVATLHFGTETDLIQQLLAQNIEKIDAAEYADKRVVIKGCGDISLPEIAYIAITKKLRPMVKSLMYGEPCSTVPVFKKK